ncbi:MAG: hypothetical protein HYS87_02810 [Candidatus Colwellbacteria bacterium]|nr:hypothetical protein [Candidatus Colwellbacteria bacterium]
MKAELVGKKGQVLVEILVALAIIAITISAIVIVAVGNQSVSIDTQNRNEALQLARAELEGVLADAKDDFSSVIERSYNSSLFTIERTIVDLSSFEKEVIVKVIWDVDPNRPEEVELRSLITDPFEITKLGGDGGGGGLTGDWQNPRTLGSISLTPNGNQGTGLDAINGIVYMTSKISAVAHADFWIIDATDGENPSIVSSLNLGISGANAVDAATDYAYIAASDEDTQFFVVDISNINAPLVASSLNLPFGEGEEEEGGVEALSIFFYDDMVYLGTKTASNGNEFYIIDVSNPLTPTIAGSYEVGGDVNNIHMQNEIAHIAMSPSDKELVMLDVATPGSITEVGSYDAPDGSDGKSVFLAGNMAYFGRNSASDGFRVIDATVPAAVDPKDSGNPGGDVNGIYTRDYLSFIGTTNSNTEFQVWRTDDPDDIQLWSSFNFPQSIMDIDYENNLVYTAVRSNDALRIITSSP